MLRRFVAVLPASAEEQSSASSIRHTADRTRLTEVTEGRRKEEANLLIEGFISSNSVSPLVERKRVKASIASKRARITHGAEC